MEKKKRELVSKYLGGWYFKVIVLFAAAVSAGFKVWWLALTFSVIALLFAVADAIADIFGLNKMRVYFNRILSSSTTDAINLPFAVAVLSPKGKIIWYNRELDRIFGGELLFQRDISSICRGFDIEKIIDGKNTKPYRAEIGDKTYDVWAHRAMSSAGDADLSVFAYFIDVTEQVKLLSKYKDEKIASVLAVFDNYEEIMQNADEETKARLSADVDRQMAAFATETSSIYKKLDRGRYFFVMQRRELDVLISKKFEILARIRSLSENSELSINPTISIGIGEGGETLSENDAFARAALDMALGRGGDQVVIRDSEKFRYYGGNSREFEKSARVKARVISGALSELIRQNDQVIVMGHKNSDIDAVGASVGIMAAAHALGKSAYMVMTEHDSVVEQILSHLGDTQEYQNAFIRGDEAREILTPKTLLVVVDTHTMSYVSNPELIEECEQIVVIDHHRRGADFIENPVLLYHEPYTSSASEMVTEMLQYMGGRIKLSRAEAEAIYAGIYLDTKGFIFKTGVRTLEAAAYLRRNGVDTVSVNRLFQTGFDEMRIRNEIISSAEMVGESIAIAYTEKRVPAALVARAADELLSISEITTSFVLAPDSRGTSISGRSMGDINVQVVLEKLGGGGHLTVAGAQLEGKTVAEGIEMLRGALGEYFKEQ